jgi:hypothetical protein
MFYSTGPGDTTLDWGISITTLFPYAALISDSDEIENSKIIT